jgi:hypothetical protein
LVIVREGRLTPVPDRGFLDAAVEWMRVATAIRASYPTDKDPACRAAVTVYRELAWAHLLSRAGKNSSLLKRLHSVLARVAAVLDLQPGPADVADMLIQLRLVVAARYPLAFRRPAV